MSQSACTPAVMYRETATYPNAVDAVDACASITTVIARLCSPMNRNDSNSYEMRISNRIGYGAGSIRLADVVA
jgi:hypothetical protein